MKNHTCGHVTVNLNSYLQLNNGFYMQFAMKTYTSRAGMAL